MRAVLDTNVIVSATLTEGGNEHRVVRAWGRGQFDLVFSPATLEELGRAIMYARLRKYRWMNDAEVITLLEALAHGSELVPGTLAIKASRDPDDDKFLIAAIEGQAEYLVTGDRDLLELGRYHEVRIVTPRAFLAALRRGRRSKK
jgi:putative PIN family toxin of toxin-antitoxin system